MEEETWVFAYGSLMWDPCFAYGACQPALLRGYHRAFCITSTHYRGTPECPGLVLGLDRGGSCRGLAFRVAAPAAPVLAALDARELVTHVYRRRNVKVRIPGGLVPAWTYVADRGHVQYAGRLPPERAARAIAGGRGQAGANLDYLRNTVHHLDALGLGDGPIHHLLHLAENVVERSTYSGLGDRI